MTAPQTPQPCPVEWCVRKHPTAIPEYDDTRDRLHESRDFRSEALVGIASVTISQKWDAFKWAHLPAVIELWKYTGPDATVVRLTADQARALADLFECGLSTHEALAAALRQAADELDRITGSAT